MKEGSSPHGYVNGRDMSARDRSASSGDPTSSMPEATLFHAYRHLEEGRVTAECACGGIIEAENDWRAICDAVNDHNRSPLHEQWRAWREEMP